MYYSNPSVQAPSRGRLLTGTLFGFAVVAICALVHYSQGSSEASLRTVYVSTPIQQIHGMQATTGSRNQLQRPLLPRNPRTGSQALPSRASATPLESRYAIDQQIVQTLKATPYNAERELNSVDQFSWMTVSPIQMVMGISAMAVAFGLWSKQQASTATHPLHSISTTSGYGTEVHRMAMLAIGHDEDGEQLGKLLNEWLETESLSTLISREDMKAIITEIRSDPNFTVDNRSNFDRVWDEIEAAVRAEKRPMKELLGPETTNKFLKQIGTIDLYDPDAVRAFLQSPAIEEMLGGILYEAIFEFLQRVDIIGGVINNLPLIGPIRQQIVAEFKKNLDNLLGGQIKGFLQSFNRVAVDRMIDFVLSPDNRQSFAKANVGLAESLLSRPAQTLTPSPETAASIKEALWNALEQAPQEEGIPLVDVIYDRVGDLKAGEVVQTDKWTGASPTISKVRAQAVERFLKYREDKK